MKKMASKQMPMTKKQMDKNHKQMAKTMPKGKKK